MPQATPLDRTDFALLAILQKNARTSNKELARAVDLAESSCLERVRRLQAAGTLRGSHAEVDPAALGIGLQAMIRVQLARHTRRAVEAFRRHCLARAEVVAVYHLTGGDDFLVHVVARDMAHLRDLALDAFTSRAEVGRIESSLLYGLERKAALPDLT